MGETGIFYPRFRQLHIKALGSYMSFLCLVFIITSDRWYRCLWFKKKCSEHSGYGTHTTQHFVCGSISSRLHGYQVAKKHTNKKKTIPLVLYSAVKKCTDSQMEKCHSKEGHRDPLCDGFGSISLWFSLLCLLLSVGFFLWMDITFDHICACQHVKGKEGRIRLNALPEKWLTWPSIPPSQGLSLRISLALNESCAHFWTNHLQGGRQDYL